MALTNNKEENSKLTTEEIGDNHVATNINTPLRDDAFDLSREEKIKKIAKNFEEIMVTLGLDLTDDSLQGTPKRVAKLYVNEFFDGLDPDKKPKATVFDNKFHYNNMLIEKNINIISNCEHHFLPIIGKAHVGYISSGKVIGLSKMNRIVEYYSKRPQVQERLTRQIVDELKKALNTEDVAVVIDTKHMCVTTRGIKDHESSTVTMEYSGKFQEEDVRKEFLGYINMELK